MLKTIEIYGDGGYCGPVCVPGTPGHLHPLHNVIDIYDAEVPDETTAPSTSGATGAAGPSAYEVAKSKGFTGTETEWLASLKGSKGDKGEPGTSAAGLMGLSAYEVALANGFVGTPAQWLASLKGSKGDPGTNGVDGQRGPAGLDGAPGAKGTDGAPGARGPAGIGGWTVLADAAALGWTNMPAATTEIFGGTPARRTKKNLAGATQARIIVNQTIVGSANAQLKLQFSTDQAAWTDAGPVVAVGAGTGLKVGAFANLVTAAKADVFLRLAGVNGDGTADPAFSNIDIEVA